MSKQSRLSRVLWAPFRIESKIIVIATISIDKADIGG